MHKIISASIVAVIVISVGGYLLLGGTRDQGTDVPPSSEASSQRSTVFTSVRQAYTLALPGEDWEVVDTQATWSLGAAFPYPGGDRLLRSGIERNPSIHIGSQPVPSGLSFDDWLADYDADFVTLFPGCTMTSEERAEVDGIAWRFASYIGCGEGWVDMEAVAFHDGRAYIVRAAGSEASLQGQGINLRERLDDWVSRLTLHGS